MAPLTRTRIFSLVGEFMYHWALMEASLNEAITKALKLDPLQSAVTCNNIQFRDKVHILRTIINLTIFDEAERELFDKRLDKLAKFITDRNMVAHNVFGPHDTKPAVNFIVTRAKGKLHFPETAWDENVFLSKFEKMGRFSRSLERMTKSLAQADLVRVLLDTKAPENETAAMFGSLGLLAGQNLQPQEPHDSSPLEPKPETNDQTPDTFRE